VEQEEPKPENGCRRNWNHFLRPYLGVVGFPISKQAFTNLGLSMRKRRNLGLRAGPKRAAGLSLTPQNKRRRKKKRESRELTRSNPELSAFHAITGMPK